MKYLFTIAILLVVLSACNTTPIDGSSTAIPAAYPSPPQTTVANPMQGSYPGPQGSLPGYPVPQNLNLYQVDISSIVPPTDSPIPVEGMASISGVLYSKSSSSLLTRFQLYITAGTGEGKEYVPPILVGPLANKGDIMATTDQNGRFEINNLPPGNYFIIVAMPLDYAVAQKSTSDSAPLMITLEANQKVPLGVVIVP